MLPDGAYRDPLQGWLYDYAKVGKSEMKKARRTSRRAEEI